MKKFMGSILGVFSDDLGIDLGTSNTLIYMKNKGIILREPSVVTISSKTKELFEVGEKAKHMIGRTPNIYETIRPLRNGVIADYEVTEKMLRCFYKRIKSGTFLNKPRVIICVPAGITQVEKRAVIEVTREAGAREAYLIEEPMASAIGVGINIFEPEGSMVVDIGGGTSELAVVSLGGVVKKSSFRVAGDRFDMAIVDYVRQKHNLLIGELAADIKKKGIYISGGGALLRGIDKKISSGLNLKVTVAEDPLNAVINGIGVLLNDFSTYSRVLVSTETEY